MSLHPQTSALPTACKFFLAALLLGLAPAAASPQSNAATESVEQLTRSSEITFRGTLLQVGSGNIAGLAPEKRLAVVRVEEVIRTSAGLGNFQGQDVTIRLQAAGAAAGEEAVFYARPWRIGENLAFAEVGRLHGDANPRAVREQTAAAGRQAGGESLARQLAKADLVVTGEVISTRPAQLDRQPLGSAEDPEWWEAVLRVDAVLRGTPPGTEVVLLFPNNPTGTWAQVPKIEVGWEGLWLLDSTAIAALEAPAWMLREPRNLLSPDEVDTARRLLQR